MLCSAEIPACEASKFLLLGNEGDHGEAVFPSDEAGECPAGELSDRSRRPPLNHCDAGAEFFVGRSIEVRGRGGVRGVGYTEARGGEREVQKVFACSNCTATHSYTLQVQKVFACWVEGARMVTLVGMAGIGKTQVRGCARESTALDCNRLHWTAA